MTFGFDGLPGDADYASGRTFMDAWKRATDLGGDPFTTIWVSDHLQQGGDARYEAISRISYLAASFPSHTVGTLVIGQGYRNPALLAKAAATAHYLSGGRVILGIGAGWHEEEHRAYGYGFPSPRTRVEQLEEAIQILKGMWQGGPFSFQGRHYEVTDAYCIPTPDPPIELLVGTNGTKALKIAATYADAWNWDAPMQAYGPPLEKLKEHCRAIGRDPKEIRLTASVDLDPPDDPTQFDASRPVAYLTSYRVGPTAEAAIEQLAPMVDEGVDHFMIGASTFDTLERFANEVAPELAKER
ncbi:MAG: LLM class flavin-dependent oxidoreductase [Actinobacteria bacterium]|nr:MAG: LLM class flavin-dependent oxidoreductase [Actinomycetota bacterium]